MSRLSFSHRLFILIFLLMSTPALVCWGWLSHDVSKAGRPQADLMATLLEHHGETQQRKLAAAMQDSLADRTLPQGVRGFWLRREGHWQGKTPLPVQIYLACATPGRYYLHKNSRRIELFFCHEVNGDTLLYALDIPWLLQDIQAFDSSRLAVSLALPEDNLLVTRDDSRNAAEASTLPAPLRQALQQHPQGHFAQNNTTWYWTPSGLGEGQWLLAWTAPATDYRAWLQGVVLLLGLVGIAMWVHRVLLARLTRHYRLYSRAAALVALGDFSFRLPAETRPEWRQINSMFNHMLDEIQRQRDQLYRKNQDLENGNQRLHETLQALQLMQGERFEKARGILLNTEFGMLLHNLSEPVEQLGQNLEQQARCRQQLQQILSSPGLNRSDLNRNQHAWSELLRSGQVWWQTLQRILQQEMTTHSSLELGHPEVIHLHDFLQQIQQTYREQALAAGHQLYVRCPDELRLYSYPQALRHILNHLLCNALQHAFSPGQSGEIVISAKPGVNHILLCVRDTGRGIPANEQARLFQAFHTTAANQGAPGLGLYLARQLVEGTLKGHLTYASGEQGGSSFMVRLPRSIEESDSP